MAESNINAGNGPGQREKWLPSEKLRFLVRKPKVFRQDTQDAQGPPGPDEGDVLGELKSWG